MLFKGELYLVGRPVNGSSMFLISGLKFRSVFGKMAELKYQFCFSNLSPHCGFHISSMLCVCVCCILMCVHNCACRGQRLVLGALPQSSSTVFLKAGSLTEPDIHLFKWIGWTSPRNPLARTCRAVGVQMATSTPCSCARVPGHKLRPKAYVACRLL